MAERGDLPPAHMAHGDHAGADEPAIREVHPPEAPDAQLPAPPQGGEGNALPNQLLQQLAEATAANTRMLTELATAIAAMTRAPIPASGRAGPANSGGASAAPLAAAASPRAVADPHADVAPSAAAQAVTMAAADSIATSLANARKVGPVEAMRALCDHGMERDPELEWLCSKLSARTKSPAECDKALNGYWGTFMSSLELQPSVEPYPVWKKTVQRNLKIFRAWVDATDLDMPVTDKWITTRLKKLMPEEAGTDLKGLPHHNVLEFWRALDAHFESREPRLTMHLHSRSYRTQAPHESFEAHVKKNAALWEEFKVPDHLNVHTYNRTFVATHRTSFYGQQMLYQCLLDTLEKEHLSSNDTMAGLPFLVRVAKKMDDDETMARLASEQAQSQERSMAPRDTGAGRTPYAARPGPGSGKHIGSPTPAARTAALTSDLTASLPNHVWQTLTPQEKKERRAAHIQGRRATKPAGRVGVMAARAAPNPQQVGAAEDPPQEYDAPVQQNSLRVAALRKVPFYQHLPGMFRQNSHRVGAVGPAEPSPGALMAAAMAAQPPPARATRVARSRDKNNVGFTDAAPSEMAPAADRTKPQSSPPEEQPRSPSPDASRNPSPGTSRSPQRRAILSRQGHDAVTAEESPRLVAKQRQLHRLRDLLGEHHISERVVNTLLRAALPMTLLDIISCVQSQDLAQSLLDIARTLEQMRRTAALPPDGGPTLPSVAAATAAVLSAHGSAECQELGHAIAAAALVPENLLVDTARKAFSAQQVKLDFAKMRSLTGHIGPEGPPIRVAVDEGCEIGAIRMDFFCKVLPAWASGFPPLNKKYGPPRLLHLDQAMDMVSFAGDVRGYRVMALVYLRLGVAVYPARLLLMHSAPADVVLPLAFTRRFCVLPPDGWAQRREDVASVLHLEVELNAGLEFPVGYTPNTPDVSPSSVAYAQSISLDTNWSFQVMRGREIPADQAESFLDAAGASSAGAPRL